nr:immunoglobulin light chain junction region [Macaca mulatta]MOW53689.1 immunoglobulin light chain junction region [Macaca mulatta]MOX23778.1 immunoglobulin light chain junction region [Macaca mulatta]MOX23824.1 immunoglobulin light chain junction region [Macaca mulatta]MOX24044.1 immunoglobulin light chain junction region [Macaca mulatta]
CLQGYRAPFTF